MKGILAFTLIGLLGVAGAGHMHAQYLKDVQPMKLAAMEALWETEDPAPFAAFALINEDKMQNDFEITIPAMFSFMVYNKPAGEIKGIRDLQEEAVQMYGSDNYVPNVTALFWAFRIMVGAGGLMILITGAALLLAMRGKLADKRCMLKVLLYSLPLPFIANSVGWFVTESGRQPWIVVGLQKTVDAVSPNLTATDIWLTIIGFTLIYLVLIVFALGVAIRFIKTSPSPERSAA